MHYLWDNNSGPHQRPYIYHRVLEDTPNSQTKRQKFQFKISNHDKVKEFMHFTISLGSNQFRTVTKIYLERSKFEFELQIHSNENRALNIFKSIQKRFILLQMDEEHV